MNYSVVYSSRTGNTEKLALELKHSLSPHDCIYFGAPSEKATPADFIFVGFWTDKGNCDDSVRAFLQTLSGKTVFLFGTAGFGASSDYYARILRNVLSTLPDSCSVAGSFMCQGKMPPAVRRRYEGMLDENPDTARELIANFDKALTHPDDSDLAALREKATAALSGAKQS